MVENYINMVLHGDSADILYELPRKSVDLVVTSPPYSDLRKYGGVGDTWNERKFREIAVGLSDVLKDGGVIVWIVNDKTENEGDVVLDPFLGSGTTALACIKTNRKFVGIELNKDYVDLANGRIKELINIVP